MSDYLVGIDGGGCRSTAVLTDNKGNLLSTRKGAGLNPLSLGWDRFSENIEQLIRPFSVDLPPECDISICAGLAGTGNKSVKKEVQDYLGGVLPTKHCFVISDAVAALWGAFKGKPGLLLIAGTGSICLGMTQDGKVVRSGGFGYIFGDEGSGYWIAKQAISESLKKSDGRSEARRLINIICKEYHLTHIQDIIPAVHKGDILPSQIAKLAEKILLTSGSDGAATRIIYRAGEHLADLVESTIEKTNLVTPKISLSGGLWNSPGQELQKAFKEALNTREIASNIVKSKESPEMGAVRYLRKFMTQP